MGYAVLLARSLDLSISALATVLEFIPMPKKTDSVLAGVHAAMESEPATNVR